MNQEISQRLSQITQGEVPTGYQKTKVGIVPEEWEVVHLSTICSFQDGKRKPLESSERLLRQGQYPYYGASGIIDWIDDYLFDEELILLGEDGENIVSRNTRLAFIASGKFWVNNHAHVLQVNENNSIYFVCEQLEQLDYRKYNTGSAQPKLNKAICEKIQIPLPPLPKQQKIAQILSTQDKVIQLKEQLLEQKKQQKKYLMQQLLTGKKRLEGFTGEWEFVQLGTLFSERNETKNNDLPLLAITSKKGVVPRSEMDLKDNSNPDKSKYLKICIGDIGYNTMRMWQGVSAYSNYEGIVSPAYTILKPESKTDALYFSYLFKMPEVIFKFYRFSQGLVDDTRNLKYKHFKPIKVYMPTGKNEQEAIANILTTADKEIELLQKDLDQEKLKKKSLMQLLLTGIVRVKL